MLSDIIQKIFVFSYIMWNVWNIYKLLVLLVEFMGVNAGSSQGGKIISEKE